MLRREVIEKIVTGHSKNRPGFLIEIPPGCDERPPLLNVAAKKCAKGLPPDVLTAFVIADVYENEQDVVNAMIEKWLENAPGPRDRWDAMKHSSPARAHEDLERFANLVDSLGYRLVAILGSFDKIFLKMSSQLLAVMRDLEQARVLGCTNESPVAYIDLYEERSRTEPGFTSEYGLFHPRLDLGLLPREAARDLWIEELGPGLMTDHSMACFEIAFSEAGGLPAGLILATSMLPSVGHGVSGLRRFRSDLIREMPACFERLFAWPREKLNTRLVDAVLEVHLGKATAEHLDVISGATWARCFLSEIDSPRRLICPSAGRAAARLYARTGGEGGHDPASLYRKGCYATCHAVICQRETVVGELLSAAAEMMAEVFGDAPRNLYFASDVNWKRVELLAGRGAQAILADADRREFENWAALARLHLELATNDPVEVSRRLQGLRRQGQTGTDKSLIYLGLRILAAKADETPLTSTLAAVPVLEHLVRDYLALVHGMTGTGADCAELTSEDVARWWPHGELDFPSPETPLGGALLALVAAVVSERSTKPLFDEPQELHRLLSILDSIRNATVHNVVAGCDAVRCRVLAVLDRLFEKIRSAAGSNVTLGFIATLVEAPRAFLGRSG